MRRIGILVGVGAVMLAAGVPAQAQRMSEGFEFLKAVKSRDGNKVTTALEKPGTTVINARDVSSGESALHVVVARRDATWLRFLLGKGATPDVADKAGITPLQLASNLGWTDGVEILVGAGASIDGSNAAGETPLISAVHRRDVALVRTLLKAGADPERTDNSGRSARDYAALMGPQSTIMAELDKAKKERAARAARAYGPGT